MQDSARMAGTASPVLAWYGVAGPDLVWQAWPVAARLGQVSSGEAWQAGRGELRMGTVGSGRCGIARLGKSRSGVVWQAGLGTAGPGAARGVMAGGACPGSDWQGKAGRDRNRAMKENTKDSPMNAHFDYQQSLNRIEAEIRNLFNALIGNCEGDQEHLTDYRERFTAEEYKHISEAFSLYHSEASTAQARMIEFIAAEHKASEGQQALELETSQ